MKALGVVETRGYAAALAAADAMKKAASVEIYVGTHAPFHTDGTVAVFIRAADVGSVKAGAEAGAEAAKPLGQVVSIHVIAAVNDAAVKALGIDMAKGGDWA